MNNFEKRQNLNNCGCEELEQELERKLEQALIAKTWNEKGERKLR
jgi:hypothetical protein